MNTRTTLIITTVISILLALAGFLLQGQMQSPLAVHWNAAGEADGYGSTFTALYMIPVMILGISLLILGLPRVDPMRTARLNFPLVNIIVLVMALYMAYIHVLTLAWNLGYRFNMLQMMLPGFGLLFVFMGSMVERAKPNWFVGIRTPWTISNSVVWEKTHRLGGLLFKISGVLALLGVFFPALAIWFILVPVLAASVVTVVYSYVVFRQIEQKV